MKIMCGIEAGKPWICEGPDQVNVWTRPKQGSARFKRSTQSKEK